MEKRIKIGIICFDLQNFTADFLNRLQDEVNDFADIKAYPIMDFIGDIALKFSYAAGEDVKKHKVKTYTKNDKHTPEGILITPNYKNAIKCAFESDVILHYGIHSSTALISGLLGFLLGKKQISVNQTLPVYWETKRKWWIRWNKKIFFAFCDLHIAQSKVSIDNLQQVYFIDKSKITYVPFEAGIHSFKEKYERIKNEKNKVKEFSLPYSFVFVGNLLIFKGLYLVIDATKILINKGIDIHLSIVGKESIAKSEPKINDINLYIDNLGLKHHIDVLGPKSLDQLVNIYDNSDVVVLPTMKDCFPKVLVEAGVAGKPMITSDACGAVDTMVIDAVNGFVFKAGSAEDLAAAMEKIANRSMINKMSLETKKIIDKYLVDTETEAKLYRQAICEIL